MLKFNRTQFDSLDRLADAAFERRVVAQLKARVPATAWIEVDVRAKVAIEHAAGLGIDTEEEVLQFLLLRLRFGPAFDREAWAQPLHSAEPDARIRIEATQALLARLQE